MSEVIIYLENYTPEIVASISKIKNRMRNTLVDFTEQDIIVVENEGIIYILANPILGSEPIFDELGNFQEITPMRNLTIIQSANWIETKLTNDGLAFTYKVPRLRILRPDLCDRIDK